MKDQITVNRIVMMTIVVLFGLVSWFAKNTFQDFAKDIDQLQVQAGQHSATISAQQQEIVDLKDQVKSLWQRHR